MILRGLVLLGPLSLSSYCSNRPFGRGRSVYNLTGLDTVVPPPGHWMLLFSAVLKKG